MDEQELCRQLLSALGGVDNVRTNDACMTRLRVGVRDMSLVNVPALRGTQGVLAVVEADTIQIVLGPGKVNRVLDAFVALTGIARGADAGPEARRPPASRGAAADAHEADGRGAEAQDSARDLGESDLGSPVGCGQKDARKEAGSPCGAAARSASQGTDACLDGAAAGPSDLRAAHRGGESDAASAAKRNMAARKKGQGSLVGQLLKHVGNVFVALLPGIVAAGLINGITNIFNVWSGGMLSGVWWYESIRSVGWALFAYLPIFAGYQAAREFGGSPILGGIAGALCVANANMPLLATYGDAQLVLPMTGAAYNPSSGGLIAALFAGALFAGMERRLRAVMPDLIDTFMTPLLVLVAGALVLVVVVQPLSAVLMRGIYAAISFLYEGMGALGGYLLAAGFLPLVSVGLHQALTPIHALLNDPAGPTGGINYVLPVLMMAGGGQVGAGIALYLKTSNAQLRGYIRDSVPVGLLGVGEPLMYAVTLPLGRPFVTACLGSGVGGALASLMQVGAVSQGASGLFGLLIVVPGQQLQYVLALLAAAVAGFALTWLFGVDEARIAELYGDQGADRSARQA